MKLQEKIDRESIRTSRWYRKAEPEPPIPLLGPDILDPRRTEEIAQDLARQAEVKRPIVAIPPYGGLKPKRTTDPAQFTGVAAQVHQALPGAVIAQELDHLVVNPARLREVATFLRDSPDFRYDLLSNVTSVDYADRFEVVYHISSTVHGGPPLAIKVDADKGDPVVPSLVHVYRGADFQEREVWDMMGIRFDGHPNLRRILLWEGFHGHPLRKDWYEAYYEAPAKPFPSRWPEGHHQRAEDRVRWTDNVDYPPNWDPHTATQAPEPTPRVEGYDPGDLITQTITVNMGPHHPSTHGVFRMQVVLDGETIVALEPVVGYLHRNHEKIGERNLYIGNIPYTDRLDYLCGMTNNFAYCLAVEKLLNIKPPERAEYIRVIMAEFTRIVNHLLAIGTFIDDIGAFRTPVLYAFEERELILDLFQSVAGSRMMVNYMRFGGVAHDMTDDQVEFARRLAFDRLPKAIDELDKLLTKNEIVIIRSREVGVMPPDMAINYSCTGPMLRGSGVRYDLRRADPYSIYDRFDFKIPVGTIGDVYDRYLVRVQEMRESTRILQQALRDMPKGEILAGKKAWQMKVPAGEAYGRIEGPKGELGFYVVSDGSANPYRYHVRPPSFINLTVLGELCKGHKVADAIAIFGSVDINMGEVDR